MSVTIPKSDIVERLKLCLIRAIEMFNRTDRSTLLCPRRDEVGNDLAKGCSGWGAASERSIAHRLAVYLECELRHDGIMSAVGSVVVDSLAKRVIEAGKVGVALTHFNTRSVAAMALPLPPLAEQQRIVAEVERRLSVLEELEAVINANRQRANRLRQAILQRSFSGKLSTPRKLLNERY